MTEKEINTEGPTNQQMMNELAEEWEYMTPNEKFKAWLKEEVGITEEQYWKEHEDAYPRYP